jgi:NADH:ubiquinone oxidoreductase subunit E
MSEQKVPKFADRDAEDLFNRIIQVVPDAMKNVVKPMLTSMAEQKAGGGPITVEAIKEMVEGLPEPQKSTFRQVISAKKGLDPSTIKAMIEECGSDVSAIFFKIMERMKYIPPEAIREIAKQTAIPEAHLFHLATTGRAFSLLQAEHQITLCAGTSCAIKDKAGNMGKIEKLAEEAGPEKVRLKKVRCLGCCDSGLSAEADGKKVTLNLLQSQLEAFLRG